MQTPAPLLQRGAASVPASAPVPGDASQFSSSSSSLLSPAKSFASFSEEDKEKMLEQMGGEEEIKAQLVLYGMVATFIGWWVGGWTW